LGPRAGLDAVAKRKTFLSLPGIKPLSSSLHPNHYTARHFILKMETAGSFETLVSYVITRRHNPEDHDLNLFTLLTELPRLLPRYFTR